MGEYWRSTEALVGIDEATIAAPGEIAPVAVAACACIACRAWVALGDLKQLFASNALPDFVVAEPNSLGVDLGREANA